MKITNPGIIAEQSSALSSVFIEHGELVIQLKNSSTLKVKPQVHEGELTFEFTYLDSKNAKSIDRKLAKIAELQAEINATINGVGIDDNMEYDELHEIQDKILMIDDDIMDDFV